MPGFLARVTDHDDHTVLQKKFSRRLSSEELPAAKGGEFNSHGTMNIGDGGDAETMNAVVMGDNGEASQGGNDEGSEMEDLVYIHVKDAVLDMSTPNFPRDDSRVWQFDGRHSHGDRHSQPPAVYNRHSVGCRFGHDSDGPRRHRRRRQCCGHTF